MSEQVMQVPLRYYLRLADLLVGEGIDIALVLTEAGIPDELLTTPDAMIPFEQVDRVLVELSERTGRSELGAELGRHLTVGSHSIVGFGMLSSATLAESLRFVGRYFRLVMPSFQLRYLYHPSGSVLHFTPVCAMSNHCLNFHLETIAMAAYHELNDLSDQQVIPHRISMSMPRPAHAAWYEQYRRTDFHFGVEGPPGVRLSYDHDFANLPLTMADTNSLKVAEARCQAQVAEIARIGQFADWVSMTMREVSDRLPTMEELANMLNISTRTLNRYLKREGTSFRALHSSIQHAVAKERLSTGCRSVSSVAYSLGYSDPANFSHAFRRLEGMSPRQYQRDCLESQS
ncbi:AraC family transcriptional regulator [bacterium]|nr:AraC family transcriptional regulator [bacterium]